MKKIITSALVAGLVLLLLSILGLYITVWFFPGIASQYFDPAFDTQSSRVMIYFLHPFIISFALSWFWSRVKGVLNGSFVTRGIEFGLLYALVATFPMMWLIYSAMNVSLEMVATWFVLAVVQGLIAGLVFEKMNP
jgi:uncharacterized membrane protein (DUF485 family)